MYIARATRARDTQPLGDASMLIGQRAVGQVQGVGKKTVQGRGGMGVLQMRARAKVKAASWSRRWQRAL